MKGRLEMAQAIQSRGPVTGTAVNAKKRRRFFLTDLYSTAVGKKYAMAITGIVLLGFVFFHMVGNLKMYLGPDEFNHYAAFLRQLLVPILPENVALWLMRLGLIGAVVLHIHSAYSLTVMNRKARWPTSPAARCAGPASSSSSSCCGTWPTSPSAG
jgi:succinate dehydrogenase / fumarate reductase, cytochrome b subunit